MRSQWGGDWPKLARDASVGLSASAEEINPNPIGSLLLDIFVMFNRKKVDRMFTRDLVSGLNFQFTSRPWMEQRKGKEINDLWLSRQLRPFGIKSSTLWLNDQSAKGYCLDDFHDVFRRYVAKSDLLALRAEYSQRPGGNGSPVATDKT